MAFLATLWLPILLTTVFVFVVSSLVHMLLGIHNGDHSALPQEDATMDAFRQQGIAPGTYVFPHASCGKEWNTDEMRAKCERGPVGFVTIMADFGMGKSLVQWFFYILLVSVLTSYVGHLVLPAGTESLRVFRIVGTIAFMTYGVSALQDSIWKGQRCAVSLKFVFDGLLYALTTAGTFAWLWPDAA